jgi:dTMP kinase
MPGINQLGKYIVLEGGDGCGKDTQLPLIVERIEALGDTVRTIREPYDSVTFGEMIRDMLFAQNGQPNFAELPPDEQARFMNLARAEIVPMIAQAISLGEHVVVSRNWLSTMAYQGHEKGLSLDELDALRMLCEDAACEIRPDMVILLDLPVTEALSRQGDKRKDVHETMPIEFHQRVRQGYISELSLLTLRNFSTAGSCVIDVSGRSIDEVTDLIWDKIRRIL